MEPVNEGPAAGKIPVGLDEAIINYYTVREWDNDGKPTQDLIKRLGMKDYAEDM